MDDVAAQRIDDIELQVLAASGDVGMAECTGDYIREAIDDGVLDEDDINTLTVVYERVIIQQGDDAA
jgi:hypothetical protein